MGKNIPKAYELVDKFGSFAVKIDHLCSWKYWNFDISNVNIDGFNFDSRSDLNFTSDHQVIYLKLKGFESNKEQMLKTLVKTLRLDWIREVGRRGLEYKNGCLVLENTDPQFVSHLKSLRQLHYDKENFKRSAPFVINSLKIRCLDFDEKTKLFEKFGIVALHILDSCPYQKKVLIFDGRQPFDYVLNRDDIRFNPGDTVLYARIRFFTEEDHLKNLDKWFHQIGYHNVIEIGDVHKRSETPEVTVSGCISTFNLFPFIDKSLRDIKFASKARYTLPMFYFRNNSGFDCHNRRVVNTIRRSIGSFTASTSRDCECGINTSSDFFWNNCETHRGSLEIEGSPTDRQLSRYSNIRRIQDGQLWIHDTKTVYDLEFLSRLEDVQCEWERGSKPKRELSAVRIGGSNMKLENVELPNLTNIENCDRLVSISGNKITLPKYSESEWMKTIKKETLNNINRDNKKCISYSGKGGQMSAEFGQQLDNCNTIEGNLTIDGSRDNLPKLSVTLQNIQNVTGTVSIRNINEEHSTLLRRIKYIGGDFIYDNNPSLKRISLSLIHVQGTIQFTRVPRFCLIIQKIRSVVEGFKRKNITLDCPHIENDILSDFEDRYGKLEDSTEFGIAMLFLLFAFYMMSTVLSNQLKPLNFTRWREVTDLDLRLKTDITAYLDEDSSEEEPDVMTWKRKSLMKNRLDGRDIEGEKLIREKKQYRETKEGIKWSQKIGALARTLKRRSTDSEFSGQSWLRRKQRQKKNQKKIVFDETPFTELVRTKKWCGITRDWEDVQQEYMDKECEFIEELNKTIREVIIKSEAADIDVLYSIMERIQKKKSKGEIVVSEYVKLEKILGEMEKSLERIDVEKWKKWTKMRAELRKKALLAYGDDDLIKAEDAFRETKEEEGTRLIAGIEDKEEDQKLKKNKMFVKVIVETMNWKPPGERRGRKSYTRGRNYHKNS